MLALHRHGDDAAGTPLLMVHGFLCCGELFSPVIPALRRRRPVITVDLPGFGESAHCPPAGSIAEMSAQVRQTLAAAGIGRAHLLGHSMGGMVALQLALVAPAQWRSLIVYASNSSGALPDRFESFADSKRRLQRDFAAAKTAICATWLRAGARHAQFELLRRGCAKVALPTAEKAIDAMAAFDVTARLGELALPTLLLSAACDKTYTPRCQQALAARLPQAQRRILHGCAHCAHLEKEEEFNQTLEDWLQKQDAAAAAAQ